MKAAWKSQKRLIDKDNEMAEAAARRRHAERVAAAEALNADKRARHARAQAVCLFHLQRLNCPSE
jgi:hypothetical protein